MTTETETNPDTSAEVDEVSATLATDDQHDDTATATDDDDTGLDDTTDEQTDDGDGDGAEPTEEIEWEGKTYRVAPEVKAAMLRQADYTRKTQETARLRDALEADREAVAQQAERIKEVGQERVQLAFLESKLKAFDTLDWDKLREEDPEQANELRWQRRELRDQVSDLSGKIDKTQNDLDLERQRSAALARAKATEDCEAELRVSIKGWNDDLAAKVGKFAVEQLGWTPQALILVNDAATVKTMHAAYIGHQARLKLKAQNKLEAGDKTTPVSRPGGGGVSPNARRTTDASGDKLSMAEWAKREQQRTAQPAR